MERQRAGCVALTVARGDAIAHERRLWVEVFSLCILVFAGSHTATAEDKAGVAATVAVSDGVEVLRDCEECPEMVVLPAGKYIMGRQARDFAARLWNDEKPEPAHEVTIDRPFAVSRYEITRGQFEQFTRNNPGAVGKCEVWHVSPDKKKLGDFRYESGKGWRDPGFQQQDDHPVVCVSFDTAQRYVQWLTQRTGNTYRLLSEAEWEYAARAGSMEVFVWRRGFPSEACKLGNFSDMSFGRWNNDQLVSFECDDGYAQTAPAGQFARNRFGLYDMIGNVKEWVADCWNDSYSGAPADGSPWLNGDCRKRIVRGASWFGDLKKETSFYYRGREWIGNDKSFIYIGLRVARNM